MGQSMVSTVGHEEQEVEGAMADSVKEEAKYMSLETLSHCQTTVLWPLFYFTFWGFIS